MTPILLSLTVAIGAPGPKEPPKKDPPPTIAGAWRCEEMTVAGMPVPKAAAAQVQFEFTADGKVRTSQRGKTVKEGGYTADPKRDPAEVDLTLGDATEPNRGIFKVEKDTLTLCLNDEDGGPRPARFESAAGTKLIVMTLKRVEAKD